MKLNKNLKYSLILLAIVVVWAGIQLYDYYLFQRLDIECKESYSQATPQYKKYNLFVDFISQEDADFLLRNTPKRYVIHPPNSIYFYQIAPELNITREIQLNNPYCYPLSVRGEVTGIIAPFTKVLNNDITVRPFGNEILKVDVRQIPKQKPGNYYGNLTLTFTPKLA